MPKTSGAGLLIWDVIWSDQNDMLCEICHKREATVHLTSCVGGGDHVDHRGFCDACFPFGSMPKEEQDAALRKLYGVPPADAGNLPGGEP